MMSKNDVIDSFLYTVVTSFNRYEEYTVISRVIWALFKRLEAR